MAGPKGSEGPCHKRPPYCRGGFPDGKGLSGESGRLGGASEVPESSGDSGKRTAAAALLFGFPARFTDLLSRTGEYCLRLGGQGSAPAGGGGFTPQGELRPSQRPLGGSHRGPSRSPPLALGSHHSHIFPRHSQAVAKALARGVPNPLNEVEDRRTRAEPMPPRRRSLLRQRKITLRGRSCGIPGGGRSNEEWSTRGFDGSAPCTASVGASRASCPWPRATRLIPPSGSGWPTLRNAFCRRSANPSWASWRLPHLDRHFGTTRRGPGSGLCSIPLSWLGEGRRWILGGLNRVEAMLRGLCPGDGGARPWRMGGTNGVQGPGPWDP